LTAIVSAASSQRESGAATRAVAMRGRTSKAGLGRLQRYITPARKFLK
jgi:hypothetical protein